VHTLVQIKSVIIIVLIKTRHFYHFSVQWYYQQLSTGTNPYITSMLRLLVEQERKS